MWAAKLGFCWNNEGLYAADWTNVTCLSEELAAASQPWADASALLDTDVDYTLFLALTAGREAVRRPRV